MTVFGYDDRVFTLLTVVAFVPPDLTRSVEPCLSGTASLALTRARGQIAVRAGDLGSRLRFR